MESVKNEIPAILRTFIAIVIGKHLLDQMPTFYDIVIIYIANSIYTRVMHRDFYVAIKYDGEMDV